ncbi:hypothetical protein [Streptomyces alboflavus]|uniref:hypothetical protein n=1 Tax=Streptomyces alboflavus TaxID=67267 RepID=UPI001F3171CD|nr:hypothetical protein [Streptomyces alboflavus]
MSLSWAAGRPGGEYARVGSSAVTSNPVSSRGGVQVSADCVGPLAHADEAVSGGVADLYGRAVVGDRQGQQAVV